MKTLLLKLITACAIFCFTAAGIASAGVLLQPVQVVPPVDPLADPTVNVPFPTAGDAYCSATNGCGTIPLGGQTEFQWTAGDYVLSSVFTLPTTSVNGATANWHFQDFLGGGTSETWNVYINGVLVVEAELGECGYCGDVYFAGGTIAFAPIVSPAGTYQIDLVLQNTVPFGGGSVAWLGDGISGFSYTVPEPGSLLLLGSGLALGGVLLRRKRRA